jgi:hypothetical protein
MRSLESIGGISLWRKRGWATKKQRGGRLLTQHPLEDVLRVREKNPKQPVVT